MNVIIIPITTLYDGVYLADKHKIKVLTNILILEV